ncbi:SURF1-like protein [Atheta coriaria]|uniref:SURF1-like protein n=1 Tax=Dalotia coriaria TaxID=877792 RepID=UPI0031F40E15
MLRSMLNMLRSRTKSDQFLQFSSQAFRRKNIGKQIGVFGWSLLVVPASTFALGTWQIQRKTWKESLIKELQDCVHATPTNLPKTLEEIEKLEYHPVHVKGHFLHNQELHMGPRTLITEGDAATESSLFSKDHKKSQGYLVITPFKLADREETILINRGWVPGRYKDPSTRPKGQVQGEVDVIGIVRLHENRPNFMPANKEAKDAWFYRDLTQMSAATGAAPIFLDATTDFAKEHAPIGGQTRISLRNEHLSYVLTWYSLSMITSFMWYTQFIRK